MCTSVHACVRDVFAIYNDNILSRLIMIIIKIIILYFIQIKHTDDFPSASIPANLYNSLRKEFYIKKHEYVLLHFFLN